MQILLYINQIRCFLKKNQMNEGRNLKSATFLFTIGRIPLLICQYKHHLKETKSDTWLPQSRVGEQVPYQRSEEHLGGSSEAKDHKNIQKDKVTTDQTNVACVGLSRKLQQTDRQTNRQTKIFIKASCLPLQDFSLIFTNKIKSP